MPPIERNNINLNDRVIYAMAVVLAAFFVLILRLWYLQVIQEEYFAKLSENNRLRTVYMPPPRGLILDRNGKVLVKNRPSFNIDFVSADSPKPEQSIADLAQVLGRDKQELMSLVNSQRKRRPFEPKLLVMDASRDLVAQVAAQRYRLPGVTISVTPTRDYVQGDLAAHILGYIREISGKQLDTMAFAGYRFGDLVGQFGIEARQEKHLQGEHGIQEVVVNATGTRISEGRYKPEIPGHNITLTVEKEVQEAADAALTGLRGAVVAMDPRTGEILALSSSPRFDPNLFTRELSAETWQELVGGKEHRMTNRVLQGVYPPGSVFKIFMAVAALAEGVMTPNERVNCPGTYQVGRRVFRCHKKTGHGSVDLKEALIQSCDVYFYTVGQRLGVDRIHNYANRFGLGQETGLALAEERPGLVPSTEWKRRYFRNPEDQRWYPGETPSVAIGQGAVSLTPIQITRGLAALVNGGILFRPYIVRGLSSADGNFSPEDVSDFKPLIQSRLNLDSKVVELVRDALVGVVNDPRGTGHRAQLGKSFDILVGGKTGTAQPASLDLQTKGGQHDDHAWFSGYAPADDPMIVVTALVENGGHGGVTAAPLVKQVMQAYFRARNMEKAPDQQKSEHKPEEAELPND